MSKPSSKKLLVVIPYYVPAWSYGGPIKVAHDYALGLIERGWEVTVVTTDAYDVRERLTQLDEIIDGIQIIRFRNVSNYLAKFHNLYLPKGMRQWLRQNIASYDVVHIHDILNLPAYRGMIYAKRQGVRYFVHPHGILSDIRLQSKKTRIKKLGLRLCKSLLDAATGIFALTQQEHHEIQNYTSSHRVHILPNGLDISKFDSIPTRDIHQLYQLPSTTKVFVYLGRVQHIKGLDRAFRLLADYDARDPDRRYLIIGPDEGTKEQLVALSHELGIVDKIIWYGMEKTAEKRSLYKGSDAFLFISRAEGFPMTILEALACGLPVIISDGCNFPEAEEYEVGKLLDPEAGDKLTPDLLATLASSNVAEKGPATIAEHYDINVLVERLASYYLA